MWTSRRTGVPPTSTRDRVDRPRRSGRAGAATAASPPLAHSPDSTRHRPRCFAEHECLRREQPCPGCRLAARDRWPFPSPGRLGTPQGPMSRRCDPTARRASPAASSLMRGPADRGILTKLRSFIPTEAGTFRFLHNTDNAFRSSVSGAGSKVIPLTWKPSSLRTMAFPGRTARRSRPRKPTKGDVQTIAGVPGGSRRHARRRQQVRKGRPGNARTA